VNNSSVLDTGKECYVNSGKTNAVIADADSSIKRYRDRINEQNSKYLALHREWSQREAEREQQKRLAREREETKARQREIAKAGLFEAVQAKSMRVTHRDSSKILREAYPLAGMFGGLSYRSTDLLDASRLSRGYKVDTRLNYLNLFDEHHHVNITFRYDEAGNAQSWEFSDYSDVIAPEALTVNTLMQFLNQ
jgi:hypothetical protein